jgi:tetratricopeptide (TPR) repeat protein
VTSPSHAFLKEDSFTSTARVFNHRESHYQSGFSVLPSAITAQQQDLAICCDTGARHSEGTALNNLGLTLREVGRFDEAITAWQDAAAIYRQTSDQYREHSALEHLEHAIPGRGASLRAGAR